jgi:small subunit ribosomal protein S7
MGEIKFFGKWSVDDVEVKDMGLKRYINLQPMAIPKSDGKYTQQQFHKSKMNIIERFINKLRVPGHRGKKHVLTSGRAVDKTLTH